jgi:hypothetical protein
MIFQIAKLRPDAKLILQYHGSFDTTFFFLFEVKVPHAQNYWLKNKKLVDVAQEGNFCYVCIVEPAMISR